MSRLSISRNLGYLPARLLWRRRRIVPPVDPAGVDSILILRYDAIGDLVVSLPFLDVLHEIAPGAAIDVLASKRNSIILNDDPRVRKVAVFDGSRNGFRSAYHSLHKPYDMVFSLVWNKTTMAGVIANLLGGKNAITVNSAHAERINQYSAFFNIQVPAPPMIIPMSQRINCLADYVFGTSIAEKYRVPRLYFGDANWHYGREHRNNTRHPLIFINLSATDWYRSWPEGSFAALIKMLMDAYPDGKVLISGIGQESEVSARLCSQFPSFVEPVQPTADIRDIAAITSHADVVISPDTSVVHLATALGTPVVVMYSLLASYPEEWTPVGAPVKMICSEKGAGISTIAPREVFSAATEMLRKCKWQ